MILQPEEETRYAACFVVAILMIVVGVSMICQNLFSPKTRPNPSAFPTSLKPIDTALTRMPSMSSLPISLR